MMYGNGFGRGPMGSPGFGRGPMGSPGFGRGPMGPCGFRRPPFPPRRGCGCCSGGCLLPILLIGAVIAVIAALV